MIFLLSPAKTLDYTTPFLELPHTQPCLLEDSAELIHELKTLSASEIGSLMSLSEKLSALNYERYHEWSVKHERGELCRQTLFAFKGDVYQGLDAGTWKEEEVLYAQDHLRVLSGLYGVLKPLDLLKPYRLEMGTRLKTEKGKNLYEFWGSKITEVLKQDLSESQVVVNLASNEYFSSVKEKELGHEVITPVFKDYKNGVYKIISFYAKKARGRMAAWAMQNQVNSLEVLKSFSQDGYAYNEEASSEKEIIFYRKDA